MPRPPTPLAAYETAPFPTVTDAQLRAIADRHGLPLDEPPIPLPTTGSVHALWTLGSRWVLRVPKDEIECLQEHRREVAVIPTLRDLGVRTPALLAADESCDLLPVPYSIVERVDGFDLSAIPTSDPDHGRWFGALGRSIATLHLAWPSGGQPDEPPPSCLARPVVIPRAEDFTSAAVEAAMLHQGGVDWLLVLCRDLDRVLADSAPVADRIVHGDVTPGNLMVDASGDAVLIDWGDAGIGHPAIDFAALPLRSAVVALDAHQKVVGGSSLGPAVLRAAAARALWSLLRTPALGPNWYRPAAASLLDLMTFAVDDPVRWREWTGRR